MIYALRNLCAKHPTRVFKYTDEAIQFLCPEENLDISVLPQ